MRIKNVIGLAGGAVALAWLLPAPLFSQTPRTKEVERLIAATHGSGERELNLSWSANSLGGYDGIKKFTALFNRLYGLNAKINLTPGPSMTDMAGKIAQEVAAGQKPSTDVFLGTVDHYPALLSRNVLEEYDYTRLSPRVAKEFVAPRNIGVEIYSAVGGIVYNTNLIRSSEAPRRLEDVLNPKWKGRIASTPQAAYLDRIAARPEWSVDKMRAFVTKLSDHLGGLIRVGEEARVISGEFVMLVLGNSHSVRQAKAAGAPLGFVIPEDSAVVHFTYLGVPRNSNHPNLAKLFINMIMSEEGQRIIYETYFTDHYALPGSQSAADLSELKSRGIEPLEIDVQFATERPEIRELGNELRKILRSKR